MGILQDYLKSLASDTEEVMPLAKAVSDSEASLSSLLDQIDSVSTLSKSAMPEVSSIEAEEAKAPGKVTVAHTESKLPASKTNAVKKGKTMEEEADIEPDEAKDQAAVKVESSETKLGADAKKGVMAEVALRKAVKDVEADESEEEEEAEHKGKNPEEEMDEKSPFGKKGEDDEDEDMMKSFGLTASDLDLIDATIPLANLKKGFDIQSDEIRSLKKSIQGLTDLFKSLVESNAKNFALNKSIATHIDALSSQPLAPKGRVSMLQKNFDVTGSEEGVSPNEVSNALLKSMTSGKLQGNDINMVSNAIATLETAGMTDSVMNVYDRFK